jgi:predicted Zn-dependent protease
MNPTGSAGLREQELVERALAESKSDDCVAIASVNHSANLRWANNTLTTNGVTCVRDLTVISMVNTADGIRTASVTRSGVSTADEVIDVVRRSEELAAGSRPADDAAPLVQAPTAPDWDDPATETQVRAFRPLADGLAAAFDSAKSANEGRFGYAEHSVTTTYLGSSTGLRLRDVLPQGRLELTGRSIDGSRSAWAGTAGRDITDLDVGALDRDVARRLEWAQRRVELDAGRYETILPPSAVADLLIDLYWTMGALDAHEGSTVFSRPGGGTRVGEQLSDLPLTLRSDPAMAGMPCTPFVVTAASSRLASVFDNGLPLAPVSWIDNGTLAALLQTRHSADVTGLATTPFTDNVELVSPDASGDVDSLVASTERGLLLTCLWYIREVDPQTLLLTGLTRDGVFLVEQGEVVGAVNNFRFNESPVGMLRRLSGVGRTENTLAREFGDYFTRTRMPALRVADFNMSSVSQAS